MKYPVLFVLSALLSACVVADDKPSRVDGAEICVQTSRIDYTVVLDGQTIVFYMMGKKVFVNKLPHHCPGLSFHKAFSYRISLGQLCRQDVIRVFEQHFLGAACMLGPFTPYVEPNAESDIRPESTEAALPE